MVNPALGSLKQLALLSQPPLITPYAYRRLLEIKHLIGERKPVGLSALFVSCSVAAELQAYFLSPLHFQC